MDGGGAASLAFCTEMAASPAGSPRFHDGNTAPTLGISSCTLRAQKKKTCEAHAHLKVATFYTHTTRARCDIGVAAWLSVGSRRNALTSQPSASFSLELCRCVYERCCFSCLDNQEEYTQQRTKQNPWADHTGVLWPLFTRWYL